MNMLLWTRKAPLGGLLAQCESDGVLAGPLCCQSTAATNTYQLVKESMLTRDPIREMQAMCWTWIYKVWCSMCSFKAV